MRSSCEPRNLYPEMARRHCELKGLQGIEFDRAVYCSDLDYAHEDAVFDQSPTDDTEGGGPLVSTDEPAGKKEMPAYKEKVRVEL